MRGFLLLVGLWWLAGCQVEARPLPTLVATADPLWLARPPTSPVMGQTAVAPPTSRPLQPLASATPPPPLRLAAADGVPAELIELARQMAAQQPQRFAWAGPSAGQVTLAINGAEPIGEPLAQWLYAVAAPFATIADEVTLAEVTAGWQTGSAAVGTLILDRETAAAFSALWGPPAGQVAIVQPAELATALWANRPAWSLVPFHRLSPDLKVLRLDGQSLLDSHFNQLLYPLVVHVGLEGSATALATFRLAWPGPVTNRDPGRLTRVAMTGVTALTRATAYEMELNGITTPGQVVGPLLQAADIAHASNEVSFAPDCPFPSPVGGTTFCARDSYLTLLQAIGIDVVELTGNHVNDWGAENLLHSLELYEGAGMAHFGGGRDLAAAQQPALFEHNGNHIAFVGCNPVGPAFAWATETRAGSRPCDYPALFAQIEQLGEEGYLVMATLQYWEFYYYPPTSQQAADFQAVATAGAAAVSGSQGHHAQGFAFANGAFIHYGLGNLFFDQMEMLGTRQSFVDTYVIYDGRLLSVELFVGLIEDFCCPRLVTADERAQALQAVFQASGW
ncbi:MAG: CapA family protein [Chloroflexi bacterium]|nr:CapA family protein [Chloroflexota bacterium]